jgi:hypothetical protein
MASDILIYQNETGDIKLDITLEDETLWLSQAQLCEVFGRSKATISEHIKSIFGEGELYAEATVRKFRTVQTEGERDVEREIGFYHLDMVIALGYRVKSPQGTQFRIWATQKLREYIAKGFVLDDERFKHGDSMGYFDELQDRLRAIRISERFFYQKIKDIYTTSIDYNPKDDKTILFFKTVQNKLLWAISSQTAAELVHSRVDISLPLLGMQSFDKEKKSLTKKDVSIAKNYLNEEEIKLLGLLVEQYLAFAETMAQQRTPMHMQDWVERLDAIIRLNGRELLTHAGKISHQRALEKSGQVYQTYKDEQKALERQKSIKELEADIKKIARPQHE